MTQDTIGSFVSDAPRRGGDIGTLLGLIMAVPVAFRAARNTTLSARLIRPIALLVIVSSRSINSLI